MRPSMGTAAPPAPHAPAAFRIEVRPGAAILIATYLAAGAMIGLVVTSLHGSTTDVARVAVQFTLLALGATIGHELGHALIALLLGRRVHSFVLKLGAGVVIDTEGGRLGSVLVALGGPVASLLIALAYASLGHGAASVASWAGLLALADAVLNLMPLTRTADGARALAALAA